MKETVRKGVCVCVSVCVCSSKGLGERRWRSREGKKEERRRGGDGHTNEEGVLLIAPRRAPLAEVLDQKPWPFWKDSSGL